MTLNSQVPLAGRTFHPSVGVCSGVPACPTCTVRAGSKLKPRSQGSRPGDPTHTRTRPPDLNPMLFLPRQTAKAGRQGLSVGVPRASQREAQPEAETPSTPAQAWPSWGLRRDGDGGCISRK